MTLAAGARLGPYEIAGAIGAGGMGEVYRARDTVLNRDVAIKVLPEIFALDPERRARFEREAQTLAALNHPNIAAIYGVEGHALVMELVDGDDLSAMVARGPMPIADVLPLASGGTPGIAFISRLDRRRSRRPPRMHVVMIRGGAIVSDVVVLERALAPGTGR